MSTQKTAHVPPPVPQGLHETARSLAQTYIWWDPAEKTLANLPRFLAHVMNLATWPDQVWLEKNFASAELHDALLRAPAGTFTPRSWNYWHVRLGITPSPLPQKQIPLGPVDEMD